MFKPIEPLINYAQKTSPGMILFHAVVLVTVATWIVILGLFATQFSTITRFYESYANSKNVLVEDALVVSTQVNELLEQSRISLDVDRLYVSKFHNGKTDLNGIHFLYFSRVAEATGAGVSNELTRTQNLPLSIFPDMLTELDQQKCYFVESVDNSMGNGAFLQDLGVRSTLVCPIWNVSGKLIGLIGADAVRGTLNTQDRERIEATMIPLATVLGGLLSTR